ncbi:alpha-2,8-sialyltransferase 8F-like isoform X1 [Kryptolebias marmoratus]|uniref:alpha-2,8-sialyltransferase 8F-like isoform X1 n=1 Tax=Kryptolebias marmoratus TaxID=37003 RepID=UPI0007F8DBC8|nr:alpha-2,8-sialyltransferase 8F-like isoform X1 [Kryptolebias marmoratus]
MRTQLLSVMIHLLFLGSLLTTLMWYTLNDKTMKFHRYQPKMKSASRSLASCKSCGNNIKEALEIYSQTWRKQEHNYQNFSSQLSSKCNGSEAAIITQKNTPLGSKIVFDGERWRTHQVDQGMFNNFAKENPFPKKKWHTCAVVGNSGILGNSNCGKMIDSAQFVIRCNLPPLTDEYKKDVGIKTNLVTANPTIFLRKYGGLNGRRLPLMEKLRIYGNSLLLLPPFSFAMNTAVSLRVLYTIEDFGGPVQPVFINPDYLYNVSLFWRSQGLKAVRPSTGIIMASLALELCENVDLYGFWPFAVHPYNFHELSNHYYDDQKVTSFHAMPVEFKLLLQLHSQGVLRMNLGDCEPDDY